MNKTEYIGKLKEELKYTIPIVEHNKTIAKHLKEIERLNNIIKEQGLEDKPNYYVKGLEGSLKEYQEEIERLNNIIKELRKMLEHKVEFHKNLDFYEDKELETQAYYNYVACLQDFDEIVEKYKLGK